MRISIGELVDVTGGQLFIHEETDKEDLLRSEVMSVAIDSRDADADSVFFAFIGEKTDAHKYIPGISAGAVIMEESFGEKALIDAEPEKGRAYIRVDSTLLALQRLGAYFRAQYDEKIIGVTGSVGKTTTRELITHVLSSSMKVFHTEGNNNSQIGVPLTLSKILDKESEIAVLEMGISEQGGMDRLTEMVFPDIAVVTNIGVAHIEYLGSKEGIRNEKLRIASRMNPEKGIIFLNGDDPMLRSIEDSLPVKALYYGTNVNSDFYADEIRYFEKYVEFKFHYNDKVLNITSSALGKHNVLNAAAALGIAAYLGLDMEKAAASLKSFTGLRQKIYNIENNITIIEDSYNASPDSMKAELDLLCDRKCSGRRIAVLGSMFELGENSDAFHREVGEYINKGAVDLLIVSGKEADALYDAAVIPKVKLNSNKEISDYLIEELKENDTVLIKASNGMKYKEIAETLICHKN